jgi:hypothetical protein
MPNLSVMKSRIANELARTDLSAEIANAIASAVSFYEGSRFYFNEARGTFSTVAGQEWYTSSEFTDLPSVLKIDTMRCLLSNRWFVMVQRTWAELQWRSSGITQNADPTDFAYYRQQLRIYPIPQAVRTIEVTYVQAFGVPDDNASNGWTNEGEELIRTHAKADLFENVIRDPAEADRLRVREDQVNKQLASLTRQLAGSGAVRAHYL